MARGHKTSSVLLQTRVVLPRIHRLLPAARSPPKSFMIYPSSTCLQLSTRPSADLSLFHCQFHCSRGVTRLRHTFRVLPFDITFLCLTVFWSSMTYQERNRSSRVTEVEFFADRFGQLPRYRWLTSQEAIIRLSLTR